MSADLIIDQGDDEVLDVTVTNPDRTATNLTGCKLWFLVKEAAADPDTRVVIRKTSEAGGGITITSPQTGGKAAIVIADTDTSGLSGPMLGRTLVWALQVRDGSADALITTLAKGTLVINRDLISTTA